MVRGGGRDRGRGRGSRGKSNACRLWFPLCPSIVLTVQLLGGHGRGTGHHAAAWDDGETNDFTGK